MKEQIERLDYQLRCFTAQLRRHVLSGLVVNLYLLSVSLYQRTDLTVIPEVLLTTLPVMTGAFLLMLFCVWHQHYLMVDWRYPLRPRWMSDD